MWKYMKHHPKNTTLEVDFSKDNDMKDIYIIH